MDNRYLLIKNDKNDIDNFLLKEISSNHNIITKNIYNKYINTNNFNIHKYRKRIRNIFEQKIINLAIQNNINIPYNIGTPTLKYSLFQNSEFLNNSYQYKREYIRFYRWFKQSIEFPFLKKFIQQTQSCNGQGSPHTFIDLWLLSSISSPGKLNYLLKRLYYHSMKFIHIFDENFYPSYKIIAFYIFKKYNDSNTTRINLTKKDGLRIAVKTLIKFHPFFINQQENYLQKIFLNALYDEVPLYNYLNVSYKDCIKVLQLLIKIKKNDINELALRYL